MALVRSKANAHDLAGAQLIEGDARDEGALIRAPEVCEAVVSSLGTGISPFRKVTLLRWRPTRWSLPWAGATFAGWYASLGWAQATAAATVASFMTG